MRVLVTQHFGHFSVYSISLLTYIMRYYPSCPVVWGQLASFSWKTLLGHAWHHNFCLWNTLQILFNFSNTSKLNFLLNYGQNKFLTLASIFWHFPWESIWKNQDPSKNDIQLLIYSHPIYFCFIPLSYDPIWKKR